MPNIDKTTPEIRSKFTIKDNTFSREVKSNPKDRIIVEVGDSKSADFKPQLKVSRWDNEVNFSIRAQEHPDATVEVEGEVIKYITPDYEVHQYEKPDASEDGGFEFEWVLLHKPTSNVLEATINTKELNFYYQGELTQEQKERGDIRPENVIGSYAVYHKTKGKFYRVDEKDYKTGKAFHIFRTKAIDANSNETWCELNIDEQKGILSVTIPQQFLDTSPYPIRVDPLIGNTTLGATSGSLSDNGYRGLHISASEDGAITFISAGSSDSGGTGKFKGVLTDTGSDIIQTNGITQESENVNTTAQFYSASYLSTPTILGGTNYALWTIWNEAGSGFIRYDLTGGFVGITANNNNYASPTAPVNEVNTSEDYSIYATYVSGGTTTSTSTSTSSSTSSSTTTTTTSTSSSSSTTTTTTSTSSSSSTSTSSSTTQSVTTSTTTTTTSTSTSSTTSTSTSSSTTTTTTSTSTSTSTTTTTTSTSTSTSTTTTTTSTSSSTSSSTTTTTTSTSTSSSTTTTTTSTSSSTSTTTSTSTSITTTSTTISGTVTTSTSTTITTSTSTSTTSSTSTTTTFPFEFTIEAL